MREDQRLRFLEPPCGSQQASRLRGRPTRRTQTGNSASCKDRSIWTSSVAVTRSIRPSPPRAYDPDQVQRDDGCGDDPQNRAYGRTVLKSQSKPEIEYNDRHHEQQHVGDDPESSVHMMPTISGISPIGSLPAQRAIQTRWEHHIQVLRSESIAGPFAGPVRA